MMKSFEEIGKQMPWTMPEGCLDRVLENVMATIEQSQAPAVKRRKSLWVSLSMAASVAAMAVIFLKPGGLGGFAAPDYNAISQCKSIDEVVRDMSAEDLGLYSVMCNYYGE